MEYDSETDVSSFKLDFNRCEDGEPHNWAYERQSNEYTCHRCGMVVNKDILKEALEHDSD